MTFFIDTTERLDERTGAIRTEMNGQIAEILRKREDLDRRRAELTATDIKLDGPEVRRRRAALELLGDEEIGIDRAEIEILENIATAWPATLALARRERLESLISRRQQQSRVIAEALTELGWIGTPAAGTPSFWRVETLLKLSPVLRALDIEIEAVRALQRQFDDRAIAARMDELKASLEKALAVA